jgi:hypothetical protein
MAYRTGLVVLFFQSKQSMVRELEAVIHLRFSNLKSGLPLIPNKMKSAEELQQKLYFLLERLQEMARKLPL